MPSPGRGALAIAIRALARRELSVVELILRLERAGVPPDEREAAIAYLCQSGYVSDARVASERARILTERMRGDAAIRADLAKRGIAESTIEDALAALAPEEVRVERLVDRLGRSPRLVRTLRQRGFSEETVERVAAGPVAEEP